MASLFFIPFFNWNTLFFFLGSVLIDADHCVDYLYFSRGKDWKLKNMVKFHMILYGWHPGKEIYALQAFHTIEFILPFFVIGSVMNSTPILLLATGMSFHLLSDVVMLIKKLVHVRAFSFIEYYIRRKKMIQQGKDPEEVFRQAYQTVRQCDAS